MAELHFPWLELGILIAVAGAVVSGVVQTKSAAHRCSVASCFLVLVCATGEWIDFATLHSFEAHGSWDIGQWIGGDDLFIVDELSAPLLPLVALLHLMTVLSTLGPKVGRFSFSGTLASEAILLALFSCRTPWMVILLLGASCIPPWWELRRRNRSTRVFVVHMGLSFLLMLAGWATDTATDTASNALPVLAACLLAGGALLRSGIVPLHCWITDLFENASFGTALLYVTPLTGAYAVMRLVLPIAPVWILQSIALLSLGTAVYAAGMAIVQREARRFFCYVLLSHASLVLVGLELATPIGLTGGLCVWLSAGMSLAGFGLVLRSVEARIGRVLLTEFHGLYEQMPLLAALFLLTGLSSIGFPGTVGFIGTELLVEGAVDVYASIGAAVVVAAAINGIAVMQVYFRVFTGAHFPSAVSLVVRPAERIAVLVLVALILGGGLVPQPGVASRYHAAVELIRSRRESLHAPAPVAHALQREQPDLMNKKN